MKRVLLDTNIYGEVIKFNDVKFILDNIEKSNLIIYGTDLIRKELRKTSKEKITIIEDKKRKIRILLLNLYDMIVKNHKFKTSLKIKKLAENYFLAYKKFKGSKSKEDIINDFLIVATATIKKLDVVYSEDNKTMLSDKAVQAYNLVNEIKNLRTPNFKSYEEFKNDLSK